MIHGDSDIQAEAFRRKHCDSRIKRHMCMGTITLKPGLCMFDCPLCGVETLDLRAAMDKLDVQERTDAEVIARIDQEVRARIASQGDLE